MKETLKQHSGNIPVILYYEATNKKMVLDETEWVDGSEMLQEVLKKIMGSKNVVIQKG